MTLSEIRAIPAIDIHSHFGEWERDAAREPGRELIAGGRADLREQMRLSNIALSVNSHFYGIFPRGGGDAVEGNRRCVAAVEREENLLMWAILNPLQPESFAQVEALLLHPKCIGIKLHPEEHRYPIADYGERIYEFAAKHRAVIDTHSGEALSMPEEFAVFANRYPEVTTIVSHLGCGYDGAFDHQIRAVQRSVHGNLYTDTSSGKSLFCNLLERAVREIGSERILFGTDAGCYFSPMQRARVDCAQIGDEEKKNILYRNALRLFPRLRERYERMCEKMRGE